MTEATNPEGSLNSMIDLETAAEAVEELRRRSSHNIHQHKPGNTPDWNQEGFHRSEARYRLLFGGNQSGKSHTAAFEIANWLLGRSTYRRVPDPPVEVWAISAEYVTLQTGIFRHLKKIIPDWEVDKFGPNVPQQDLPSYIRLKNGSQVSFKSAKGEAREKFQAAAVHLISIDEEVTENIWTELQARTLATGGSFIISATLVESYDWIVTLEETADEGHPEYFITRLRTDHNPYLHKATVEHLKETWSEEEKLVRIEGRSRRSTGLVYNTFTTDHVIEPFSIPLNWPRWCAIDPGIRTFAALWVAVSPDNLAYAYRELYEHNCPLWELAATLRQLEGWKLDKVLSAKYDHYVWEETDDSERIIVRLIDDKRGSRLITGEEGVLDQLYNRYGISSTPADKVLRPGIEDIRQWLLTKKVKKEDVPRFRVFKTCHNFLAERKRYRIRVKTARKDQNSPIDEPIRKDNHLMDCWRYIARTQPKWQDRLLDADDYKQEVNPYTLEGIADRVKRKREEETVSEFLGTEW